MNNSNIILIDNNENKKINIFNELKKELIIDIKDNASIVVNYFSHIKDLKSNINIKIGKNSSIIFNHAYINENNYRRLWKSWTDACGAENQKDCCHGRRISHLPFQRAVRRK